MPRGVDHVAVVFDKDAEQLHGCIEIGALQCAVGDVGGKFVTAGVRIACDPHVGGRALRRNHDAVVVRAEDGGVQLRAGCGDLFCIVRAARAVAVHVDEDGVGLAGRLVALGEVIAIGNGQPVGSGVAALGEDVLRHKVCRLGCGADADGCAGEQGRCQQKTEQMLFHM